MMNTETSDGFVQRILNLTDRVEVLERLWPDASGGLIGSIDGGQANSTYLTEIDGGSA